MTTLLHTFPDDTPYLNRLREAELDYLFSSEKALGSVAENYVGLAY
jgi:p-hydroxybenzoate 3-monooxygenase